jgi:hypothetical protein
VSFWRAPDGNIRWLVVIGLMCVMSTIVDAHRYGAGSLRWLESFSFAVACFAAVPLEEPARRGWPYGRKLRTRYGLLSVAFFAVAVGLFLWRVTHELLQPKTGTASPTQSDWYDLRHDPKAEPGLWSAYWGDVDVRGHFLKSW